MTAKKLQQKYRGPVVCFKDTETSTQFQKRLSNFKDVHTHTRMSAHTLRGVADQGTHAHTLEMYGIAQSQGLTKHHMQIQHKTTNIRACKNISR